jgi:hypothetical protein
LWRGSPHDARRDAGLAPARGSQFLVGQMRNKLISALILLGMAFGVSGCIVHTRPRACGYGTHWNGYRCAANYRVRHHVKAKPARRVIIRNHR